MTSEEERYRDMDRAYLADLDANRRAKEEAARERELRRQAERDSIVSGAPSRSKPKSKASDGEPGIVGNVAGLLAGGLVTLGFTNEYAGDYEIGIAIAIFLIVGTITAYSVDFIVRKLWWLILVVVGIALLGGGD